LLDLKDKKNKREKHIRHSALLIEEMHLT
jgi:hypothetical protein